MFHVEHIAIWVQDIEKVCGFYQKYLGGIIQPEYHNPTKGFTSRFITFEGGARIEVMHRTDIESSISCPHFGWCHVAISLGSKENVDKLTAKMEAEGVTVVGQPRTTGDGYYESVVQDPEGNLLELTV
ncbi:MAG: VOC family protein [Fibrobacter sp.]|nr:VOC family protein [Fibrobacter sp.]